MNNKVVIGWVPSPLGGMLLLQQGFVDSLLAFLTADSAGRKVFGGYTFAQAGYIPASRHMVVQSFIDKTDAEWLLSLDWDVTYQPEDVYTLLDAADPVERPIIGGTYVTYFGDNNALRPCWMNQVGEEEYVPVSSFTVGEIVPLTVVGMGFTLIHRSVFEAIAKNYDDPWPWFGHDVINGSRTGEDLTFCRRAREAGFGVWGHGGVLLGHTKARTLTPFDMHTGPERSVLNIGCRSKALPLPREFLGWKNVTLDIESSPEVDLVMNARDLIDTTDLGFDGVYMSHVLEHFSEDDVSRVLAGVAYVLKPGGGVVIRTPDTGLVLNRLEAGADPDDVAYESPAGPITWRDMLEGYRPSIEAGHTFMAHQVGFTLTSLYGALVAAGFDDVAVVADEEAMELVAQARVA